MSQAHKGVVEILKRVPRTCRCIGVALPLARSFRGLPRYIEEMRPALASITHLERLVFGYVPHAPSAGQPAQYEESIRRLLKEYDERNILEWQTDFDADSCLI